MKLKICLAVISLNSALNKNENNYPQVVLKECKCIKKVLIRQISSDDSDESDEE